MKHWRFWAVKPQRPRGRTFYPPGRYATSDQRAYELLLDMLSDHERRQLHTWGGFVVRGSDGRKYWVTQGQCFNVYTVFRRFCALPYCLPTFDGMLAQKLLIETDVKAFKRIANGDARSFR